MFVKACERDEIDSTVTAMQYSVAFSQILITNFCHESQGFTASMIKIFFRELGEGPRPYQFQLLAQVVGQDAGFCPNQCTMSLTKRWIIPLSFFYGNFYNAAAIETLTRGLSFFKSHKQNQALNLSLTPTPTFISSHETPPSRILQAYCEEPSMKAASRHSRLGADAMPCQLKVTSLVQQLWWQWKEKPVKGRRIGGVGEGEGCPKWKQLTDGIGEGSKIIMVVKLARFDLMICQPAA
uniref:Uncharacterized protein n=1 Tax=Salix viminalis TaxID=40686 RepID=A0A6N2L800_SALVM